MVKIDVEKIADKYFVRARDILVADRLNPWVNMQVFVRKGPGKAAGTEEALDLVVDNSNIEKAGGRIYAKKEGSSYEPRETQMNIIAPAQEIIALETAYLGVLSSAITLENDKKDIDLKQIQRNVEQIVELSGGRPIFYFGARHWHYLMDKAISKAAFDGGATDCSTDNGAEVVGKKGMGTIPHALENVYAYYFGLENAVVKSTEAFDKYMDKSIPRVALVDYANKEISDTIATMEALSNGMGETSLDAVRVDTCGENIAEGGIPSDRRKYWTGEGVVAYSVAALRKAMDLTGYTNRTSIVLSSGFSNPEKVRASNEAEIYFGLRLYDSIGAGFLDGIRTATADIVAVGESPDEVDFYCGKEVQPRNIIHKVGRPPRPNYDLARIL